MGRAKGGGVGRNQSARILGKNRGIFMLNRKKKSWCHKWKGLWKKKEWNLHEGRGMTATKNLIKSRIRSARGLFNEEEKVAIRRSPRDKWVHQGKSTLKKKAVKVD